MESNAVAAARRQLAALASEHQERLNLASRRVQESDERVAKANAEQLRSAHKLAKRLQGGGRELERAKRETFSFSHDDEPSLVHSSRRWPGSTPESRQQREAAHEAAKHEDEGQHEHGRRRMRSWEDSWRPDGGSEPPPAAPAPERRPVTRRPAPRRQDDDEDMSGQSWMR